MAFRSVPADAAAVSRAFQMANYLPARDETPLRVLVLGADGGALGSSSLRGYDQVEFLRDQLQIVGFFQFAPESEARQRGCDVLLKEQPGAEGQ